MVIHMTWEHNVDLVDMRSRRWVDFTFLWFVVVDDEFIHISKRGLMDDYLRWILVKWFLMWQFFYKDNGPKENDVAAGFIKTWLLIYYCYICWMILGNKAYFNVVEEWCFTAICYDGMIGSHLCYWCCIFGHRLMILKLHCLILHIDDDLLLCSLLWFNTMVKTLGI